MSESIQYAVNIVCGAFIIAICVCHPSLFSYIMAGVGTGMILFTIVGVNLAAWVGSKQDLVITDPPETKPK